MLSNLDPVEIRMKTKEKYVAKQLLRLGYRCVSQCKADLVATLR